MDGRAIQALSPVSQALADPPCSPDFSSPIRSLLDLARSWLTMTRTGDGIGRGLVSRSFWRSEQTVELILASRVVGLEEEWRRAWPTFFQPLTSLVWVKEQRQG